MSEKDKPATVNEWAHYINRWAESKGWNKNLVFERELMNIHAEISEAWEEIRDGHTPDEIYFSEDDSGNGKPEGVPIELADAIIRILHICGHRGWNIQEILEEKMMYNESRPYRHGGKVA